MSKPSRELRRIQAEEDDWLLDRMLKLYTLREINDMMTRALMYEETRKSHGRKVGSGRWRTWCVDDGGGDDGNYCSRKEQHS